MKRNIATVALAIAFATPVYAKGVQMTPMEIQALQSREFETTKEILFASVVSVFQDLGYQLENADMASGFITASSANKNKTGFWDALAKQSASGNTRVTAFVEVMPGGMARVRLNFLNTKTTSGQWGGSSKKDKAVLDPATYKAAWEKIDEAIFTRQATAAPATPGTPATVTASPAAISVPVTPGLTVTNAPVPSTAGAKPQ